MRMRMFARGFDCAKMIFQKAKRKRKIKEKLEENQRIVQNFELKLIKHAVKRKKMCML